MLPKFCRCNVVTITAELVLKHLKGAAFLGISRLSAPHHESPRKLLATSHSSNNCGIASHDRSDDWPITPAGSLSQADIVRGRQLSREEVFPIPQTKWFDVSLVGVVPQVVSTSPPWISAAATRGPFRSQRIRPQDATNFATFLGHNVRCMRSQRHDDDRHDDDDDDNPAYDRSRKRDRWRPCHREPSDDSWGEQIAGGGSSGRSDGGSRVPRQEPWVPNRGPSREPQCSWVHESPSGWKRRPRPAPGDGGGGRGGGGPQDTGDITAAADNTCLGRAGLQRAAEAELLPNDGFSGWQARPPLQGRQPWQQRQQQRQQQQQWQQQQQQEQKAPAAAAEMEALNAALEEIRTAGSLRKLEAVLNSLPAHLLGPRQVATASVTYSQLINEAKSMTTAPQPPPLQATATAAAAAPKAAHGGGGDVRQPPPLAVALRERLQMGLLEAAPSLGLRELSYCLYGLSTLPQSHTLLTRDDVGRRLLEALVTQLEVKLYGLVDKLHTAKAHEHHRHQGRGGGGGRGVEGGGKLNMEVQFLTYSCTALRRLSVARPSVYRALAAAAAPMLGHVLVGEMLPPLVLGFLEAGNPEPLFMDQLIRQSSSPYSLARTNSIFAGTVLLRAAGLSGAEPAVVDALSSRLTEILQKSKQQQQQQQQRPAQTPTEPASATATAATTANNGSVLVRPSDHHQEQPQQRWTRVRPSRQDLQITYTLQACADAGLTADSELVKLLLAEVKQRQSGWDMLHRLMTARYLHALGINAVASLPPAPPAAAVAAWTAATTPPPSAAAAATTATTAAPTPGQPPPPSPPGHRQQQQQQQSPPPSGAGQGEWSLILESEVLSCFQKPNITISMLLNVLHGVSQLRAHPKPRGGGGIATATAAAAAEEAGAAAVGNEYDMKQSSTATLAVGHTNQMPTALGFAVQLVDAAAPVMAAREVMLALTSLAVAGVRDVPPPLLQRAEQIYKGASHTGGGGAVAADVTQVGRVGPSDGKAEACGGGGGGEGYSSIRTGVNVGSTGGLSGAAAGAAPRGDLGDLGDRCESTTAPSCGNGGGNGDSSRDVMPMCATVGRVLAWQPAAASMAMLSDDFVRHCRDAALGASRSSRWKRE